MDELEFLNIAEGSRDGNTVDFRNGSERRPPLHVVMWSGRDCARGGGLGVLEFSGSRH